MRILRHSPKILICLVFTIFYLPTAFAEKRTALVIGNASYRSSPLKNPVNDATEITRYLKIYDFDVIEKRDATCKEMRRAIDLFYEKLKKTDVGLFYYAGHGIQLNGHNYLIPVDTNIVSESDVEFDSIDAGRVLGKMEDAGNRLNIVILDACRNNPFQRSFRSTQSGLAQMDAPRGSIVAYATAPGSVAVDGEGDHGLYTSNLIRNMQVPGLKIEDVFKRTRNDVEAESKALGILQTPWESSSLTGDFYFVTEINGAIVDPPVEKKIAVHQNGFPDKESLFWQSIMDSTDIKMFDLYMQKYPQGTFLEIAKLKIATYRSGLSGHNEDEKRYDRTLNTQESTSQVDVHHGKTAISDGTLYVKTLPTDTKIRILNIKPTYFHKMELQPGKYHIEASKPDYRTIYQWVELNAGENLEVSVELQKAELKTNGIMVKPGNSGAEKAANILRRKLQYSGIEAIQYSPKLCNRVKLLVEVTLEQSTKSAEYQGVSISVNEVGLTANIFRPGNSTILASAGAVRSIPGGSLSSLDKGVQQCVDTLWGNLKGKLLRHYRK